MRVVWWAMTVSLCACATDVPEGRFACDTRSDCPDGWVCRADGRCWSTPGGPDTVADAGSAADGAIDGAIDGGGADAGACTPGSCGEDRICRDGVCIAPMADEDMDGVPTGSDCDDTDAAVGTNAERACSGECAVGVERCVMGTWEPCDAPTECSCSPGDVRELPCGNCGRLAQRCGDGGTWEDDGECTGEGACSPGAIADMGTCGSCGTMRQTCLDTCEWDAGACIAEGECAAGASEDESTACGACGSGMQTRSRACDSACAWGAWDSWSTCTGESGCMPGAIDTTSQGCGNCNAGTQMRTRTCSTTCGWGSWGSWSSCAGGGACMPGTIQPQSDCTSGGNCTRTRECRSSCGWGAWGSWGSCSGCAGGTTQGQSECCNLPKCDSLRIRNRSCSSSSCAWGGWGAWGSCL